MRLNNKILITGAGSGLGQFLCQKFNNSIGITRANVGLINKYKKYKMIIHCAFNQKKYLSKNDDVYEYLFDNLFFTQKLLSLKYDIFIYISSIEVYKNEISDLSVYLKKFSEAIVQKFAKKYKILRCSMILGPTMRENHITKILNKKETRLSLSKNSQFNYILMQNIFNYLYNLQITEKNEIIDFVSSKNIKLEKVSKLLSKKKIFFGNFSYKTPKKFKNPIYKINKSYNNSSKNNLLKFNDQE